jgi:hypothetical protein
LNFQDEPFVYEGWINEDVWSHTGRCIWESGDYYEGEWKDNEISGQGKYVYADGEVQEGTFRDGLFLEDDAPRLVDDEEYLEES